MGLGLFFLLLSLGMLASHGIESILTKRVNIMEQYSGDAMLLIQLLSHVFGLILPAFILSKTRNSIKVYLGAFKIDYNQVFYSLLLLIVSLPIINLLTIVNLKIPLSEFLNGREKELEDLIKQFLQMDGISDLMIRLIIIAIIPAIGEEWIFRGIVQNQLIRFFNHPWIGLMVTAIIFSGIHMQFQGFLPRFGLGIILGYCYLKTNSLFYPVLLHLLFNAFQILMVYWMGVDAMEQDQTLNSNWTLLIIPSIISIPVIYWISKNISFKEKYF